MSYQEIRPVLEALALAGAAGERIDDADLAEHLDTSEPQVRQLFGQIAMRKASR
jgi:DNA-binding GntR family transcriptional regulator